jgi:hypothetical protein
VGSATTVCLDTQAAGTGADQPTFNSMLFDCGGAYGANATAQIGAGTNNTTATPDSLTAIFINGPTETARTAVDPLTLGSPFFTAGNYIGAVQNSADRWWADWSCGLEAATPC